MLRITVHGWGWAQLGLLLLAPCSYPWMTECTFHWMTFILWWMNMATNRASDHAIPAKMICMWGTEKSAARRTTAGLRSDQLEKWQERNKWKVHRLLSSRGTPLQLWPWLTVTQLTNDLLLFLFEFEKHQLMCEPQTEAFSCEFSMIGFGFTIGEWHTFAWMHEVSLDFALKKIQNN